MADESDEFTTTTFPGDDHEHMKSQQRGWARWLIRRLFLKVCRELFLSRDLQREEFERLWALVEGCSYDKPLLPAYDHLCALYRKQRKDWMGVMPEWGDEIYQNEQSRLFSDWMSWWWDAVKIICEDPPLRQACADCFVKFEAPGDAAKEAHLLELIRARFPI